jgi:DNA replication and repair protein RecF
MIIKRLAVNSFRNFEHFNLQPGDKINVFYGKNGSGKTNILEAIFVLLLARSPRSAGDLIMIRSGSEFYRIDGDVDIDDRLCTIAVAFQNGGRKKITIDDIPRKAGELYERFCVVCMAPDDIRLLSGPPSTRREFLNTYLSQVSHKYLQELTFYQKALAQKNAYLREGYRQEENPYDELLVRYGVAVMLRRQAFLRAIADRTSQHYAKISNGQTLRISYRASVDIDEKSIHADALKDAFLEKLAKFRGRERDYRAALVGPHRDEVEFVIGELAARTHGSQGEWRSAAVSLKMAIFEYIRDARKVIPVLLLDEIFAELDDEHREMLIDLLGGFGQLFLTTASQIPVRLARDASKFRVENGAIHAQ